MHLRTKGFALGLLAALLGGFPAFSAEAAKVNVAVAANFTAPAEAIAKAFKEKTGTPVAVSAGSSGALFAQITQGAPFAVFLSADAARPQRLEEEGFAVAGSRFTYALGKLVLWSTDPDLVQGEQTIFRTSSFTHLAIANPETAPYGAAAMQVLAALGVTDAVTSRIVTGQSVAQAFAFVESGNAELGFVALSQLAGTDEGSRWLVPETLYAPIRQDAVLLDGANDAARAFLDFLKGAEARGIIGQFGYNLPG